MHRDEWDDEDEEPKWAGAPLTTKEKDMLRYYYYIHNGIDTRYVVKTHSALKSGVLVKVVYNYKCQRFLDQYNISYLIGV